MARKYEWDYDNQQEKPCDYLWTFQFQPELMHDSPVVIEGFLTERQCDALLARFDQETAMGSHKVNKFTSVPLLPDTDERLYRKVSRMLMRTNARNWRYNLVGMLEPITMRQYVAGGRHNLHTDYIGGDLSKLSCSVLLSSPRDFTGGGLEFLHYDIGSVKRGDAVVFPGWMAHKVNPITKGKRTSLLAWCVGQRLI